MQSWQLPMRATYPRTSSTTALSLSALFVDNFREGIARIVSARESDPLNPVHLVRQILLLLRFGESGRALELARSLQEQLPSLALPAYLRALATHREAEFKRAANAAAEIVADHPSFFAARFLQAESQLRSQFKGLRKLVTGLPRGEAHTSWWLDITAKLVLAGGEEGRGACRRSRREHSDFFPRVAREGTRG